MEYCSGGELFDKILDQDDFSEQQVCEIMKQIIHSILYCHKNGICHRDIKPDNFIFQSSEEGSSLKLIDFGLASSFYKISERGEGKYIRLRSTVGTVYYMSPEVIQGDYNSSCDMWSIGVILYLMLAGEPPFGGDSEEEILESVLKGEYTFDDRIWKHRSEESKDLILKLFMPEDERLSPKETLKHPWFKKMKRNDQSNNLKVEQKYANRLKNFHNLTNSKKCIYSFIAARAGDEEIQNQIKVFRDLDRNHDGYITQSELKSNMMDLLSETDINEILNAVDTDKNGAINYNEFIAATLGSRAIKIKK